MLSLEVPLNLLENYTELIRAWRIAELINKTERMFSAAVNINKAKTRST